MDRKKLYRNRTMEEVAKRFTYTVNNATDPSDSSDTAKQTVDTAIDTVRYAGGESAETIKAYSDKLRNKPASERRSETLKTESGRGSPGKTSAGGYKANADPERAQTYSHKLQKEKIKREYAKSAREAQKAGTTAGTKAAKTGKKAAEETGSLVSETMSKVAAVIAEHPIGAGLSVLLVIVLLAVMCTLNSCGMVFGSISSGSVSATYSAEDEEIIAAEAVYKGLESELLAKASNAASLYPGYDEYVLNLDAVEHDPWCLTAALTVKHEDFTRAEVEGTIAGLFNIQYDFETQATTEVRYRTEARTGYYTVQDTDSEGHVTGSHYESYTYYVRVPYDYTILTVTIVNHGFDAAMNSLGFDAEQMELYQYMVMTKGEKEYLF